MPELKLIIESQPRRLDLTRWLPRVGVALFFIIFGVEKLFSNPGSPWVQLFAEIGLGQWFRYVTGVLQVTGAILLLSPMTSHFGAAVLACTMVGAIFVHPFVLHTGSAALFPAVVLVVVVIVGWGRTP